MANIRKLLYFPVLKLEVGMYYFNTFQILSRHFSFSLICRYFYDCEQEHLLLHSPTPSFQKYKVPNIVVVLCCCGVRHLSQFSLNKFCYCTSSSFTSGRYGFASVFTACYIKYISVSKSNVDNHPPWIKDYFYLLHTCLKGKSKVPDESQRVKILQARK